MVRVDPDATVDQGGVENARHVHCEGEDCDAVVVSRTTLSWPATVELQITIVADTGSGSLEQVVNEAKDVGEEKAEERWVQEEVCSQCRLEGRSSILTSDSELACLDAFQRRSCGEYEER